MLVGLLPPSEGTITIDNMQLKTISADVKEVFGFVPDSQEVLGQLTGWEYLEFVRRVYHLSDQQWQVVDEYLTLFHMTQKAHHLLETYSHGQRKKIQFIAALLHQPLLLLLDEPFSGLDPEMIALAKRLVCKLRKRGVGILLSTHDLLMAEDICDTVLFMNQGKIVETGSPAYLLSTYSATSLEEAFLKALGLDLYEKELDHVLAYF
jgi:ABC-2 type transport system ATP-binding protein